MGAAVFAQVAYIFDGEKAELLMPVAEMGELPVEPSRNFSALLVEEKIARTKVVMRERDAVNRGHISFQPMGEFRDEGDILVAILFPEDRKSTRLNSSQ